MSPDEVFVLAVLHALAAAGLEAISGGLDFASVRSRSRTIPIADAQATVASLADIIRSKEAANRAKDRAVLPLLRDALRVMSELEKP